MTRITKMGGRKAPLKASNYFDDDTAAPSAVKAESADAATAANDGSGNAADADNAAASAAPPAKSLQSRLKLLRLKIKKTTNTDRQSTLRAEMRDVERRIREENGRRGGNQSHAQVRAAASASGANSSALGTKRKREEDMASAEANPWKRMEADRRSSRALQQSTDRRERRANERASSTVCFACRAKGHSAKDCPQNLNANASALGADSAKAGMRGKEAVGICFRCGSTEHSLKACRKSKKMREDGGGEKLPYATCFVCGEKGHLSSQCPQNATRGIYPEGGSCKVCKSIHHLVKDCPENKNRNGDVGGGADVGVGVEKSTSTPAVVAAKPPKKVVSF